MMDYPLDFPLWLSELIETQYEDAQDEIVKAENKDQAIGKFAAIRELRNQITFRTLEERQKRKKMTEAALGRRTEA